MTIISLEDARHHLRVEPDYPEEQIKPYLEGAEELVQLYLNRRVYPALADLQTAQQGISAALQAAADARAAALEATKAIGHCSAREMMAREAEDGYLRALAEQQRVARGMVITPNVKSGILLTMAHLDENRETVARGISVADMPKGAEYFLWPSRVGLGI